MNYYGPRQRRDGRWDYTVLNDNVIVPVGYCSPWRDYSDELLAAWGMDRSCVEKDEALKDNHHEDGHATSEEACECYKRYLLDRHLHLKKQDHQSQKMCAVCQNWTQLYARVGGSTMEKEFRLCEEHNTKENVAMLLERPDQIWVS